MKNLYKQFNELHVDEDIQEMPVSELEKARVKSTVMKQKKNNHLLRNLTAAAILLIGSSVTLGVAYPALASQIPVIGGIYALFSDYSKQAEDYDAYSSDIGVTKKSNGISITLTNAVYDGETITGSFLMESETDLGDSPELFPGVTVDGYRGRPASSKAMLEKVGDRQYAGVFSHNLVEGFDQDIIKVNWNPGSDADYSQNTENQILGDWSFQFTLEAINYESQALDLAAIENDITVKITKMTQTPISTVFHYRHSADLSISEKWESIFVRLNVTDNLGNEYKIIDHLTYGPHAYSIKYKITTSGIPEGVTSIIITPEVEVFNDWHVDMEKFTLTPIEIPIE